MLKKLLMNVIMLGYIMCGTSANATMVIVPAVKPHHAKKVAQVDHVQRSYKASLLTKLIGEEVDGYEIIDYLVTDDRLYFILFKDGIFYTVNFLMKNIRFSAFEDKDFELKVGQLFSKRLEQEEFGDSDVSEDGE